MAICIQIIALSMLIGEVFMANILLIPLQYRSTVSGMKQIGRALASRNHKVDMLLPDYYQDSFRATEINYIIYKAKYSDVFTDMEVATDEEADGYNKMTQIDVLKYPRIGEMCKNLFEGVNTDGLKKKKYDVAIIHAYAENRCIFILPYKLDIPVISVTAFFEPWLLRCPDIPSFVPFIYTDPPMSTEMSYWERVNNLWTLIYFQYIISSLPASSDELVRKYAPEKPYIPLEEIASRTKFWLIESDILLDYPRPIMPNMAYTGGFDLKPPKPLPDYLDKMFSSAKGPVILASFGSLQVVTREWLLKLVESFEMLSNNELIIFRWTKPDPPKTKENINFVSWIPQNDILGHKKTKLFITHGGMNSQIEAVYHGVPMITFPNTVDQPYNAKRAEYHGYSKTFDFDSFDPKELTYAIKDMLNNSTYTERIAKASAIMKARKMTPLQTAVYHTEQIINFGDDHLRTYPFEMPYYQYLMLDIFVPLVLVFCITFTFVMVIAFKLFTKILAGKEKKD